MVILGERLGRGIVTDAITTPVVNTTAYFFKKTSQLIDFKVCLCFTYILFLFLSLGVLCECECVIVIYFLYWLLRYRRGAIRVLSMDVMGIQLLWLLRRRSGMSYDDLLLRFIG